MPCTSIAPFDDDYSDIIWVANVLVFMKYDEFMRDDEHRMQLVQFMRSDIATGYYTADLFLKMKYSPGKAWEFRFSDAATAKIFEQAFAPK